MAAELGEDERDEELPEHDDRQQPDVARSGGADTQDEQRIDADDRRDVAERDSEVLEQVENASQLLSVPELRKLGGIRIARFRCRDDGFATHVVPPPYVTATAGGVRPEVSARDHGVRKRLIRR